MLFELLSAEARVLLLTIGSQLDIPAITDAIRQPGLDWNRLIWLADREKAVPALLRGISMLPDGIVPPDRLAQLTRLSRVTEFRMRRLEQLLVETLDTLAVKSIDVVLLKGAGLATTVYDSFSARPMYDLDLLVHAKQAQSAWDTLRAGGWEHNVEECPPEFYNTHYHLPPLDDRMRTGLSLELHTSPTHGAIALTADLIWNDARPVRVDGRHAFVPSAEHQVLHLATHFAWTHGLASAAWRTFNDLDRLISNGPIDWNAFARASEAARAGTLCYWTFRLARNLAGAAVPDSVMKRLRPPRPEWLLKLIERHYAGMLLPFSHVACPSVRMTQLLWSAGIAPRWSGHGDVRPWHLGEVWAVASHRHGTLSLRARLQGHAARGREWRRYVSSLIAPGDVLRQH